MKNIIFKIINPNDPLLWISLHWMKLIDVINEREHSVYIGKVMLSNDETLLSLINYEYNKYTNTVNYAIW